MCYQIEIVCLCIECSRSIVMAFTFSRGSECVCSFLFALHRQQLKVGDRICRTSVRQRVQFKLAVLVFKALHELAPQCLTGDCQLISAAGRRQLRSSDAVTCVVPRTRMPRRSCVRSRRTTSVERFADQPRQSDLSLGQFRRALKTHLFDCVCRA